jgi:hypothetical protein
MPNRCRLKCKSRAREHQGRPRAVRRAASSSASAGVGKSRRTWGGRVGARRDILLRLASEEFGFHLDQRLLRKRDCHALGAAVEGGGAEMICGGERDAGTPARQIGRY